jgi:hypothetical protein
MTRSYAEICHISYDTCHMKYGICQRLLAFTTTLRLSTARPASPRGLGGVLLRLLIELPFALVRTEVVVRALKLGFCGGLLIVHLHSTNWISVHCHCFLLELKSLAMLQARQAKLSDYSSRQPYPWRHGLTVKDRYKNLPSVAIAVYLPFLASRLHKISRQTSFSAALAGSSNSFRNASRRLRRRSISGPIFLYPLRLPYERNISLVS